MDLVNEFTLDEIIEVAVVTVIAACILLMALLMQHYYATRASSSRGRPSPSKSRMKKRKRNNNLAIQSMLKELTGSIQTLTDAIIQSKDGINKRELWNSLCKTGWEQEPLALAYQYLLEHPSEGDVFMLCSKDFKLEWLQVWYDKWQQDQRKQQMREQ